MLHVRTILEAPWTNREQHVGGLSTEYARGESRDIRAPRVVCPRSGRGLLFPPTATRRPPMPHVSRQARGAGLFLSVWLVAIVLVRVLA